LSSPPRRSPPGTLYAHLSLGKVQLGDIRTSPERERRLNHRAVAHAPGWSVLLGTLSAELSATHHGNKEQARARTGGDILVEALIEWGVDTIFGLPGDGINGIMEALRTRKDKIKFVHVRHEEAAAFMACGYAKFTGRLGVCLATSGPGGIHLLNGLQSGFTSGIQFAYANGTLTLTGNATIATYLKVLKLVKFATTAGAGLNRTLSFQVTDDEPQDPLSNVVTRQVTVG
jgi:hypothetical protein